MRSMAKERPKEPLEPADAVAVRFSRLGGTAGRSAAGR